MMLALRSNPIIAKMTVLLLVLIMFFACFVAQAADSNKMVNTKVGDEQQINPAFAVSSTGTLYVAWEDYRDNYNVGDIYFSNSTTSGTSWGADVLVNEEVPGHPYVQSSPDLAARGPMTVYCVWHDKRNDVDFNIFLSISNDGGGTWGADIQVTSDSNNQTNPQIVVEDADTLYICWDDDRNGYPSTYNQRDIYFRSYDPVGQVFSPEVKVNDDTTTQDQMHPKMDLGPNGTVYIAYEDGRNGNSHLNQNWDI
jgi:hypothetical protein